jgi:hypothetical protein
MGRLVKLGLWPQDCDMLPGRWVSYVEDAMRPIFPLGTGGHVAKRGPTVVALLLVLWRAQPPDRCVAGVPNQPADGVWAPHCGRALSSALSCLLRVLHVMYVSHEVARRRAPPFPVGEPPPSLENPSECGSEHACELAGWRARRVDIRPDHVLGPLTPPRSMFPLAFSIVHNTQPLIKAAARKHGVPYHETASLQEAVGKLWAHMAVMARRPVSE